MAMSFIQRVALRFSLGKVVERWWKVGGKVVERWWKGGGKVVERWWKGGGKVVERWCRNSLPILPLFHGSICLVSKISGVQKDAKELDCRM